VARLDIMRRLTAQGIPAAAAARAAVSPQPAQALTVARHGGGHAIGIRGAGPAARGLARAAMRLDAPAMVESITAAVAEHGVVATWESLLCPVLVGIGERHAATGRLVEVEHLLSQSISQVLAGVLRPRGGQPPRIVLACADEEQHSLPIEALAAALAEYGCAARLLGARLPAHALEDAVRRTGPACVVVWSHAPDTAGLYQLRLLLAARPRPLVIIAAGPGWPDDVPDGIERPADLPAALALTLTAVRAAGAGRGALA
jgi:hypothetical protein